MARIAGVDLPRDKRVEIGLTYIFGVGLNTSQNILKKSGIILLDWNPTEMNYGTPEHPDNGDIRVASFLVDLSTGEAFGPDRRRTACPEYRRQDTG